MYSNYDYRKDLIVGMNAIVIAMNNEEAYYNHWIYIVPDCCTEEDLEDIAGYEDSFNEVVSLFMRLCKTYLVDGLYIDEKLFTLKGEIK